MVSILKNSIDARSGIDRILWIAMLCVVATAIFSVALLQLSIGILTLLVLVTFVRRPGRKFRSTVLDGTMLAFILGRALSVPFSINPAVSIHALHIEIIFYAVFYIFTNTLRVDREDELIILVQILVLTAVIAAVIGTGRYAFGISPRASSTTSGPYTFSLYLAAVLPFALFRAADRRIFRSPRFAYAAVFLLVLGIIFSLNRMHWIAMVGSFIASAIITKDRRPLIAFVLVAASAILIVPDVALRFQLTLTAFSHSTGRDTLWRGATMLFAGHPLLGYGPRTFTEIFPLMSELLDKHTASWHNDFLQVYMESGLAGLVPLLWLIGVTVVSAGKALRSPNLPELHRQILVPLLVSFSLFVIVGGMLDTVVGIIFRLYLAMIALMITESASKQKSVQVVSV